MQGALDQQLILVAQQKLNKYLHYRLVVNSLDDVDFTISGPPRTDEPEGRPSAAADWHVVQINDEEASIVRLLGTEPHALTAIACDLIGHIAANVSTISACYHQSRLMCFS